MTNVNTHKYLPLGLALLGLLISPFIMRSLGLTPGTATDVVIYAMAALGLNLLVGHTGLTSFGHGAFFGIGAYAAALSQKHWFEGQMVLPILFTIVFCALLATLVGALILRRRGVYFSLLTLAFSALTFAIAFRWTALTGGENGLGNVVRPEMGF
ncbi:MAG: branched-chain amino acid ABC transporter permease, partial [Alcaligenaceae bacterium]